MLAAGRAVHEQAADRGIGELAPASPKSTAVELVCDGLDSAVLEEELVDEAAYRGLVGVGHELLVDPVVAERWLAAGGLAELCADLDRGGHPRGDLFTFPGRERCDHGVEEPPGRGRGVDRFLEGDQVRVVVAEDIGELEELFRISREPSELGEDEAGDMPGADVRTVLDVRGARGSHLALGLRSRRVARFRRSCLRLRSLRATPVCA